MIRYGNPKWFVEIWGDWQTVVRRDSYRDILLGQMPIDEDDADNKCYRVPCEDTAAIVQAIDAFSGDGLRAFVACEFTSDDKTCRVYANNGDCYRNAETHITVDVAIDDSKLVAAIGKARDILAEAVK